MVEFPSIISEENPREALIEKQPAVHEERNERPEDVPIYGFFYLGVVGLLCYNFFLQVIGLLAERTRQNFVTTATFVYAVSNNVGQLICIFTGPYLSMNLRICFSCALIFVVSLGYPLVVNSDVPLGFHTGIGLTFALGFGNAVFQSAGFGLAAMMGERALNFMSFGQSFAGLVVWPSLLLLKLIISRVRGAVAMAPDSEITGLPPVVDTNTWPVILGFVLVAILTVVTIPYYLIWFSRNTVIYRALQGDPAHPSRTDADTSRRGVWMIIWKTLPLALTVWFLLFVTFLVFPGVVLSWEPTLGFFLNHRNTYSEILIYTFQVFDAVGKLLALVGLRLSSFQVRMVTPWRLAWAVLFFAAGAGVAVLRCDVVRIGLIAVLAITNGLLITWCMIWGPGQVRRSEREVAGYVMSFFLVFGITCGTLAAMFLNSLRDIQPVLEQGGTEMKMLVLNGDLEHLVDEWNMPHYPARIYNPLSIPK